MDRQSIERRDFPIARRGYDIETVDAHLARVADEHEALARRGRADSPGGLAASAAEQVRMIVEAAEQSAEDIAREAQLEARQLRQDAREEAERLRTDAGRQAREHVARVAEVARGLLDRVEGMDRELGSLLEGLRGGGQRLAADLSLLQANVEEIRAAAEDESGPDVLAGPDSAVGVAEQGDPGPAAADDETARPDPSLDALLDSSEAVEAVLPPEDGIDEPGAVENEDGRRAEADGARMVALNMALNGVPREQARDHLAENFPIDAVDELLDDVYARAAE